MRRAFKIFSFVYRGLSIESEKQKSKMLRHAFDSFEFYIWLGRFCLKSSRTYLYVYLLRNARLSTCCGSVILIVELEEN